MRDVPGRDIFDCFGPLPKKMIRQVPMDILMVEQSKTEPSYARPAEKAAEGGKMDGFESLMEIANRHCGERMLEKAGAAEKTDAMPLEAASEADGCEHAIVKATEQFIMREAVLTGTDVDIRSDEGYPGDDEDSTTFDTSASEALAVLFLQQGVEKARSFSGGSDTVSVVSSNVAPASALAGGYSAEALLSSQSMKNGVESRHSGLETTETGGLSVNQVESKGSEVIAKQSSLETGGLSEEALLFEKSSETLSETSGRLPIPVADPALSERDSDASADISKVTVDGRAAQPPRGAAEEVKAEGVSLTPRKEDGEAGSEGFAVSGPGQGNSSTGSSAGFQPGSGSDNGSDMTSGNNAQGVPGNEARPSTGFSIDHIQQGQPADRAVAQAEAFERLGEGVRFSASNGMKEVRINLHPEELGGVTIRLRVDNNTVTAHILVDSQSVKSIFDSDTGRLRDVFAQNGLALDKCTVELGSGQSFAGGFSGGEPHRWSEQPLMPPRFGYKETAVMEAEAGSVSRTGTGRQAVGVDLFV